METNLSIYIYIYKSQSLRAWDLVCPAIAIKILERNLRIAEDLISELSIPREVMKSCEPIAI